MEGLDLTANEAKRQLLKTLGETVKMEASTQKLISDIRSHRSVLEDPIIVSAEEVLREISRNVKTIKELLAERAGITLEGVDDIIAIETGGENRIMEEV